MREFTQGRTREIEVYGIRQGSGGQDSKGETGSSGQDSKGETVCHEEVVRGYSYRVE